MSRPSETLLEFDALLEIVRGLTTAEPGRRALAALRFSTDCQALEAAFAVIGEAVEYLGSGSEMGFGALADPAPWLEQLRLPAMVLDPRQLLEAAGLVETASETRKTLTALRERWPLLAARGEALVDLRPLAALVRRAILPSGEISDDASPQLKRLRAGRAQLRERTLQSLRAILRRLKESGAEEDYVTLRNDRYVIPVRSSERRSVPGVVHGASSTGQTVFVEPFEAVEQNNEMVRLAEAEAAEIARILEDLTGRLREQQSVLARMAGAIGELDSTFARARFARKFACTLPRFTAEPRLRLVSARHPVLEQALQARGRQMVPVTLELGGPETVMVVSGPNAGGKTVVLKTVGLAALSAQSAIPVAANDADLPLADRVLVDIGDEQSITADLSTFSAHMLNLRSMLDSASEQSIVLIDEIGTGTAPEEGSALAIAILDRFRERRSLTIATTHHDRLKTFALGTAGVVNAAVEFDTATLQPTYRLLVGLPGTSSGIEIARRLGLPAEVIERATREMEPEALEAGRLIDNLHRSLAAMEELKRQTAQERLQLEQERARLRGEWTERQRKRIKELERGFEEALARVEKDVAQLAADVQDRKLKAALERQKARRLAGIRSEARAATSAAIVQTRGDSQPDLGLGDELATAPLDPDKLSPGMHVRVRGIAKPVIVRRTRERSLEIQAGPLRMTVPLDDVLGVVEAPQPGKRPATGGITVARAAAGPTEEETSDEINVIGCTVEEASERVDRFLDRAALENKPRVRIVHGYGTGALRRGLAEFLKTHPLVESLSAEKPGRGGEAVTVVELKT